jgi:hypothetical protein
MIVWWGIQIVEPPCASSGSANIQRSSLAAENRASLAIGDTQPVRITATPRSRSPPGQPEAERQHRPQIRRWASGGNRQPRQTNLHPNRLRNGVSCDFSHYPGSQPIQEPDQPF